jgi:hypothetical protein
VSWSEPIELIRDEDLNIFNDKNTLTADPNDSRFAYAVWDRLEIPKEQAADAAFENTFGFRGPTWFARTMVAGESWEPARKIFDPGQENQTIGNQIAVLPVNEEFNGELVNIFNLIVNFRECRFVRGRPVPSRGDPVGRQRVHVVQPDHHRRDAAGDPPAAPGGPADQGR